MKYCLILFPMFKNYKFIVFLVFLSINYSKILSQEISISNFSGLVGLGNANIIETYGGDFLITGYINEQGSAQNFLNGLVLCVDSMSNVKWAKTYGGLKDDFFSSAIMTNDSNFVLIGGTKSYGIFKPISPFDTIRQNIFIVKIDSLGNLMWSYSIGDSLRNFGYDITERPNGDLMVLATTNQSSIFPSNEQDVLLICLSSAGSLKWNKVIYSSNGFNETPSRIVNSFDGGLYISGETRDNNVSSVSDIFILKLDSSMTLQWAKTTNDTLSYGPALLLQSDSSNLIFAFSTKGHGTVSQFTDFVVTNLDNNGNATWSVKYGNQFGGDDNISALARCRDNSGLLFASSSRIGKMTLFGNLLWSRNSTSLFNNNIKYILEKVDKGITYTGINFSQFPNSISKLEVDSTGMNCEGLEFTYPQVYFNLQTVNFIIEDSTQIVYSDSGCVSSFPVINNSVICSTMTSLENALSEHIFNLTIYPNPFSDLISINYKDRNSVIRFEIYNNSGSILYSAIEVPVQLNLENYKKGIYIVRVITFSEILFYKIVKI